MTKINKTDDVSKEESTETTSKLLSNICERNTADNIRIDVLLKSIDSGGFVLLILIFAILLIIPTPPGVANIAGLIIMFFSFQMMMGFEEVWLPKFLAKKSISRKLLATIVEKSSIYLYKLERFTRKRLTFMDFPIAKRVIGLIIFFLATITLTPIIFANSVPGVAIALISFGFLNKDGLIVIIGFIIGFISIFVVWIMFLYGKMLVMKALERIF